MSHSIRLTHFATAVALIQRIYNMALKGKRAGLKQMSKANISS
ncbi:MAG: hypothetical protein QRY71_00855 [Candidatus Rhabdochlamydia sp.]